MPGITVSSAPMTATVIAAALSALVPRQDGSGLGSARVTHSIHHDVSARLEQLQAMEPANIDVDDRRIDDTFDRPPPHPAVDRVAQRIVPRGLEALPLRSFEGIGEGLGIVRVVNPPDANGDVGPHHYLQVTNGFFVVFAKSGVVLFGPSGNSTVWNGFNGTCGSIDSGDPIAAYDGLADRWLMSYQARNATEGHQCIAVSQTADPLGAWYRYEFAFPHPNDYSKLAIWPSAYVLTTGIDGGNGPEVCALDRAQMLIGATATQQCFTLSTARGDVFPADLDGAQLPQPGRSSYVFDLSPLESALGAFKLEIDWQVPSSSRISSRIPIPVAAWTTPCPACIPQPGTIQELSTLGGELMNRVTYRNFGDHEAFLIVHSADVEGTVGVRWYELRPDSAGGLAAFQQGTFAPDTHHRWMGSGAMDRQGNIALGYSVSSAQLYPSIRYVGRLAGDPKNMMTLSEGSLFEGSLAQVGTSRWGDYSAMQVDPIDECTFWYTTEHAGWNGYGTRIGAFRLPGCEPQDQFDLEIDPSDIKMTSGQVSTVKVTSHVSAGASKPVILRVDGLPPGVRATFAASTMAAGETTELTLATESSAAMSKSQSFSVEGTSSSFQGYALGRIQIESPATVTPQSRSSGCNSTGAITEGMLVVLAGALSYRAWQKNADEAQRRGRSIDTAG